MKIHNIADRGLWDTLGAVLQISTCPITFVIVWVLIGILYWPTFGGSEHLWDKWLKLYPDLEQGGKLHAKFEGILANIAVVFLFLMGFAGFAGGFIIAAHSPSALHYGIRSDVVAFGGFVMAFLLGTAGLGIAIVIIFFIKDMMWLHNKDRIMSPKGKKGK